MKVDVMDIFTDESAGTVSVLSRYHRAFWREREFPCLKRMNMPLKM